MSLDNTLNSPPYNDDFDSEKNYHRVLFRPSTAVQARELTQVQTVLQDQIEKFGKHIFMDGSIIEGCTLTFDDNYKYVKLKDTYANGSAYTIDDFVGLYVQNANGLRALIVNSAEGFESNYVVSTANTDFGTIFVKYLNSAEYSNSTLQKTFDASEELQLLTSANVAQGNVTVANSTSVPIGTGYAATITEGTLFQKGFFINVYPQTVVVTRYTASPNNVSIGFKTNESIVTSDTDSSLLDNAQGTPNYTAPGAHRLKLTANVVVKTSSDISNTSSFFAIAAFSNGYPSVVRTDPQYNDLGRELARREFETNGNYVVSPFVPSIVTKYDANSTANTTYNQLSVDSGLGYVNGFRVQTVGRLYIDQRKGTDYKQVNNQIVSATFGNYVNVNEYAGEFDLNSIVQIELHNNARQAITNKTFVATSYTSGTKIGTAYVKAVAYTSGTPGTPTATYRLYIFNVQMSPGYNFSQVRSIQYQTSSAIKGVADVVTETDVTTSANVAFLNDVTQNRMIYKFGQRAMKTLNGSTQYTYRDRQTGSFATNGSIAVTLASVVGTGTESYPYSGTLSDTTDGEFIVVSTANVSTTSKTGTANVSSSSNVVTGTSTTFLTDYVAGDFITINTETHRIAGITNNIHLTTASVFAGTATAQTHVKTFRNGYVIPITTRSGRTISVSGSTATINLGETLASTMQAIVYYNTLRASTTSISKAVKKARYVKIDCSNNAGGTTGPWCLGLADVIKVNAVYVGNAAYSNSGTDYSDSFTLDSGQRDSHYDLASLNLKSTALRLSNTSTLLVSVDHFTFDRSQGVGFFSVDSYPIDDANTANTNAITTQQIPIYTSADNQTYDLRDCVDFRPFGANTAVSNTVVGNATINPSNTLTFDVLASGSFLPAPDSTFQTDLQYYLGRTDRLFMTPQSTLQINEGVPSENPRSAPDFPSAMTLALIKVPPYPSLSSTAAQSSDRFDYAVTSKLLQNRRFTMQDIGTINSRVDRLEYYTSLSLLEKSAKDLLVRSDTTGGDRFKNGFLVDSFTDHSIAATDDDTYSIAVDSEKGEIRPRFMSNKLSLGEDTAHLSAGDDSKLAKIGDRVMLAYDHAEYISQPWASKVRSCVDAAILGYIGSITLTPSGNFAENQSEAPEVVCNIDLASNWINMSNAWGTNWGDWRTTSTDSQVAVSSSSSGLTTTTSTSTTTNQNQTREGMGLGVSTQNNYYEFGNFVQNVQILPYIMPVTIRFHAVGLRPNTRVWPFFADVNVSDYVQPAELDTGGGFVSNINMGHMLSLTNFGSFGDALTADSNGELYGSFTVPGNTFRPGTLLFKLCDTDDLTVGASAISTMASAPFATDSLSVTTAGIGLQTREATVALQSVTQTQVLSSTSVKTSSVTADPPIPPYIPPPAAIPYYDPSPYTTDFGGGDCGCAGCGGGGGGGSE